MSRPLWLPPILNISNPVPHNVHQILWTVFQKDFNASLKLQGIPVWWNKRITDGYEEGFWHIISKSYDGSSERSLDIPRAEKLPWCAPLILNSNAPEVTAFDHPEDDGKIRTYLWLEELAYMAVLQKQKVKIRGKEIEVMRLITAYSLDSPWSKEKMLKKKAAKL